jgi:hypothetical protein
MDKTQQSKIDENRMALQMNSRTKTGGRTKGTPNKITNEVREILVNFLDEKTDEVMSIWKELDNREKIGLFIQLAKIVLPKQIPDYFVQYEQDMLIRPDFSHLTTDEIIRLLDE